MDLEKEKPTTEQVLEVKRRGRPRKDKAANYDNTTLLQNMINYKSVGSTSTINLVVYYGTTGDEVKVTKVEFFKGRSEVSLGYMIQKKGQRRVLGLIKKAMRKAKVRDFSLSFDLLVVLEPG